MASFSIQETKEVEFVSNNTFTYPYIIPTSFDISGYYKRNGEPINNQFYPALSNATTEKAISTWTSGTNIVPSLSSWNSITWSPELNIFAMVRQGGGTSDRIATSPDGINWTTYKSSNKSYQGIVWCNDLSGVGMFVATASSNPTSENITISTDGITWTDVSTPSGYQSYGAITYSPSLKRVIAVNFENGFVYSDDGYNWTSVPNNETGNRYYYSIAWSPKLNLFATVAWLSPSNKPIAVSPDGINWTSITPNSLSPVVITNSGMSWSQELGIFCCVGDGKILISSDGYNWDYYTSPLLPTRNLTWSPQLRIFLGGNGNSIIYSYNGIDWTSKNIGFNGAKSSSWSPELGYFLIGGDLANTSRSFFTGRPPTSYNVFDSSFNNISELGLWNFPLFGRGIPITKTTSFTVAPSENWIICNGAGITVTLPNAATNTGEEITIKTISANAVTSSPAIVQLDGTENTSLLTATAGKWKTIVSNGSKWVTLQAN